MHLHPHVVYENLMGIVLPVMEHPTDEENQMDLASYDRNHLHHLHLHLLETHHFRLRHPPKNLNTSGRVLKRYARQTILP